ncbi:MAG: hypothetical protein GF347_00655 [Candidatus Moranbacteria bacterium]|nr:hypothetical protein [Candidatus Moranbacteria bacterium]
MMMQKEKYNEKLKKIAQILDRNQKILLTTHKRPDGDAFGSTLALQFYLKSQGKKVDIVYFEEIDSNFKFLPGLGTLDYEWKGDLDYDLFVVCDASCLIRTGLPKDLESEISKTAEEKLVFIDHHPKDSGTECLFSLSVEEAATCKIIYDFFVLNQIAIDKNIATCLLTGIFTDTGGFLHANTTSQIMRAASNLMKKGAVLSTIARRTYFNKTYKTIKIWGKALERTKLNKKKRLAYSYITLKDLEACNAKIEDLSGVTNVLGALDEISYSLFLAQTSKDKIKASLRSEAYKKCNVSKIAKKFNGGGHPLASGFEIKGKIDPKSGILI